jgi:hypothetical protein
MNVDRHYETFACFCSLTLFVSSCPTNSFFPLPESAQSRRARVRILPIRASDTALRHIGT